MRIAILGAGAWGTALACHAASGHATLLWGRDPEQLEQLRQLRENRRYLAGVALPRQLELESGLERALRHPGPDGLLLLGVPVAGLRPLARSLRQSFEGQQQRCADLLILAKGFEQGSGLLPQQVLEQEFAGWAQAPAVGLLSGPSFALEVARGLPVALTVAARQPHLQQLAVRAMHQGGMRVYASDDCLGVAVGGAVKNVMAIACGVCDGLQQGNNARAALITRGLAEMARLGQALGARLETFMGLSGLGDLVLTCTGDLSRNRRVGLQLAAGLALPQIVSELGHVAEGVNTAQTVFDMASRHQVAMPITAAVCDLLQGRANAAAALHGLLAREPRAELGGGSA